MTLEPAAGASTTDLPPQNSSKPQHLLSTLVGEYLDAATVEVPSGALVALMAEFGITESGARAALSRVARRGVLESHRNGRSTSYSISPQALSRHRRRMMHFLTFGTSAPEWSGEWTVVLISVSDHYRAERHAAKKELRDRGFAPMGEGVWVRPGPNAEDARAAIGSGSGQTTIMVAKFVPGDGLQTPEAAFKLDDLAADYANFRSTCEAQLARFKNGEMDESQCLLVRTNLMDTWRSFADSDPDLPHEVLPPDWPRAEARETFLEVHNLLGPPALSRIRQIVSPFSADAAEAMTYFTTARPPRDVEARV